MVLVDTSIWVTHLRSGSKKLATLLDEAQVACHPFVIGELACGHLVRRREILSLLQALPSTPTVTLQELFYFVEQHALMGKGIGFVDAHLLASAQLTKARLWTADKRLRTAAHELHLAFS